MATFRSDRRTERDIQQSIVDYLRWNGWMVREMSQRHAVHGDMIGMPDVIAWKHGMTLLIECKKRGGRMRQSQKNFLVEITPHLGDKLHYLLAFNEDELIAFLGKIT